ncbi:MAG TPA: hypothetical protein VGG25_21765 [Streptosporangiaceae bacterium]|jgi:hypothetical protein
MSPSLSAAPDDWLETAVPVQQPWVPEGDTSRAGDRAARDSRSAATRYLCAAVALSPSVRRQALEGILEEEHRAVVTTPGVDLVTVMKYALAARRREVIRDTILLIDLLLLVILTIVVHSGILFLVLLVAAWVTVGVERYANSYGAARALRPETFDPGKAPEPASNSYAGRQLVRIAAASASGNVTLYSRFPPFVGYGTVTSSWSFTVDVTKPQDGDNPRPFSVHDVYDCVKDGLARLDFPGLQVTERVFVNGRDISDDRRFLRDRAAAPVISIDSARMRELMEVPEERARPYLTIGMTGWEGDLAVTQFIRFLLSRSDLFVEAAHTVVPPLRAEFKSVDDRDPEIEFGEFIGLVTGSLLSTIPRLLGSVPGVIREMSSDGRRERKRRLAEKSGDYGALLSLREQAADTRWQRYFQVLDDARYVKVVEQRIFRSLVEFLDKHDVDTSSLVSRSETLVNNGVMVTGGTLNAQAVAAGPQAQASASGIGAQAASLVSRMRGGGEGRGGQ